jgi:hypothetical protein
VTLADQAVLGLLTADTIPTMEARIDIYRKLLRLGAANPTVRAEMPDVLGSVARFIRSLELAYRRAGGTDPRYMPVVYRQPRAVA